MKIEKSLESFSPVIIAPTFNNARTLAVVLDGLHALPLPIIVINDGSTDDTPRVIGEWRSRNEGHHLTVVAHEHNRGKAAALLTGFAHARTMGYTHAATMDTDGQLEPEEIPRLIAAAMIEPDALVLGSRDLRIHGCPLPNRFGWWLSALAIWLETGRRIRDSQCGLRVYPLQPIESIRCRSGRFGFEAEIITRAAWAGLPVKEVPVSCRYFSDEQRVSHFRPWRDGARGFLLHARLTMRRLLPWPHPRAAPGDHVAEVSLERTLGRTLAGWLLPQRLWWQLRHDRFEQSVVACGVGLGAFFANVPVIGLAILLAAYSSGRLHLHLLPALAGSLLSFPPVGTRLAQAATLIGSPLLYVFPIPLAGAATSGADDWALLGQIPFSGLLGGVIVGFACFWLITGLSAMLFRLIPVSSTK